MSLLTDARLAAFLPSLADPPMWATVLTAAMDRFDITSRERIAAFLAQTAHESSEYRRLAESLDYSATRLMAVWPARFPIRQKALAYEHRPQQLGNYVYAKRLGNGDEASGDGWRFRGRGLIQVTGRANYLAVGEALGLPLVASPELLEQPDNAALSAAWFWKARGLNALADDRNDDDDDADFVRISVTIAGGRTGLDSRRLYWARAKAALA